MSILNLPRISETMAGPLCWNKTELWAVYSENNTSRTPFNCAKRKPSSFSGPFLRFNMINVRTTNSCSELSR